MFKAASTHCISTYKSMYKLTGFATCQTAAGCTAGIWQHQPTDVDELYLPIAVHKHWLLTLTINRGTCHKNLLLD